MSGFDPEKWKIRRERGFFKFVLLRGIVFFGLPYAILAGTLSLLIDGYYRIPLERWNWPLFLVLWTIGGLIFGVLIGSYIWYRAEYLYKKHNQQIPEEK